MYWLRRAAKSGHAEAIKMLKSVEAHLCSTCALCHKRLNSDGKKCVKCKSVYYCSKDCQVKDWKNKHKSECVQEVIE